MTLNQHYQHLVLVSLFSIVFHERVWRRHVFLHPAQRKDKKNKKASTAQQLSDHVVTVGPTGVSNVPLSVPCNLWSHTPERGSERHWFSWRHSRGAPQFSSIKPRSEKKTNCVSLILGDWCQAWLTLSHWKSSFNVCVCVHIMKAYCTGVHSLARAACYET